MDVKRGEALNEIRGALFLYRMEFTRLPFSISQYVSSILNSLLGAPQLFFVLFIIFVAKILIGGHKVVSVDRI